MFTIARTYRGEFAGWVADDKHNANITFQREYACRYTPKQLAEFFKIIKILFPDTTKYIVECIE